MPQTPRARNLPASPSAAPVVQPTDAAQEAASQFFETRIRPLLAAKCFGCHGDTKQQNGLRLNTADGLRKGGLGGAVALAGKQDESALIRAVRYDAALKMPPDGKLSDAQIADLTAWVRAGAFFPEANSKSAQNAVSKASASAASAFPYPADRRNFWSFQPVKNPSLPVVKNAAWCKTPIDRFILARLEAKGLKPAAPADRRTLIRRATFDLTGLPPTPEEVEAFAADKSPDAWSKVVDRLLASPRYGERWARHWLDVARYADSYDARGVGGEGDISEAWRYRDWVVNAFNRDLPYNQFMKYQIAGDLLNVDGTIATGLLAIGNWGNGDADKEKILTDIADDQVDVISRGMMGLTVACARCHDHKFDPIPTKDYYGLAGIFFSSHILPKLAAKGAGENPLRIPLLTEQDKQARAQYQLQLAEAETQLQQERRARLAANALRMRPQIAAYVEAVRQYALLQNVPSAPASEAFAKSHGLEAWAFRQWRDWLGMGNYTPMTQPQTNVAGNKGLFGWRGAADCPNLLVNTTAAPFAITTLTLPPRSVAVHPGPQSNIVVAWNSPVTGVIRIGGRVADADPNGGDGVAWAVDIRSETGRRELASGEIANGGAQDFKQGKNADALRAVHVHTGDRIELVILPKENYICDTTTVEMAIVEQNGTVADTPIARSQFERMDGNDLPHLEDMFQANTRIWNLSYDLTRAPFSGTWANPCGDRYGNAGVWQFEDMGDQMRAFASAQPQDAAFSAALAQWRLTTARMQKAESSGSPQSQTAFDQAAQTLTQSFASSDERSPFWIRNPADEAFLPPADRAALAQRQALLDTLRKNAPPPITFANGAQEGGVPESPQAGIHDVRVHIRGNYARLGDLVPRHFPVVLAGDKQPSITQGSGRRQLADWLASDSHPLTSRVWVNRVWQHHFGQGLVRTPSNFGFLGERPTHPELLNWLANRFVAEGWSTKKLHRLILLSATYQQASEANGKTLAADPDNRLWGRMNRARLEAEAVRDSLLAVSGRMDTTPGGVAFRDITVPRRTLYYMTIRSDRSGFGPLFDAADSTASVDRRTISTVAPQSLYLLNNPFVLAQTQAFAQRLAQEIPDGPNSDQTRIRRAYLLLYARPATLEEIAVGAQYLQRARAAGNDKQAWEQYSQILLCANEFVYVD